MRRFYMISAVILMASAMGCGHKAPSGESEGEARISFMEQGLLSESDFDTIIVTMNVPNNSPQFATITSPQSLNAIASFDHLIPNATTPYQFQAEAWLKSNPYSNNQAADYVSLLVNVTIVAGTNAITLTLLPTTDAAALQASAAPLITSFSMSPADPKPGDNVSITATVENTTSTAWTDGGGTLSNHQDSQVDLVVDWVSTETGVHDLTLTASNDGMSTTVTIKLNVVNEALAVVSVEVGNSRPELHLELISQTAPTDQNAQVLTSFCVFYRDADGPTGQPSWNFDTPGGMIGGISPADQAACEASLPTGYSLSMAGFSIAHQLPYRGTNLTVTLDDGSGADNAVATATMLFQTGGLMVFNN
jgi:hypothetical protein